MSQLIECKNTFELLASLLQSIKPAPEITVDEWSERYRILSNEETSAPGPWQNSRTPYLVEPMRCLTDPKVHEVVLLCARQMGKSSIFLNYLGYIIHMNPSPVIVIQPTGDLAAKFSQERISSMFRDTPCLRGLVPDDKSRNSGNRILHKQFINGYLIITGANSTSGIISMPVPKLLMDEIDQYPRDLSRQGDVISIAKKMQTNFPNWKTLLASTPTVKGDSRIDNAYEESTQERWCHKCPSCGKWSQFGLRGHTNPDKIVWHTRLDFETLKMICPHCEAYHTRKEWDKGGGKYIADNPGHEVRGFHVNGFDHPVTSWELLVKEWREASNAEKRGDLSFMTTFINSRLAETWEQKGEVIESHSLESRREIYNAEIPDGVCYLVAGVDVQIDSLRIVVLGLGLGKENWLIQYSKPWGDPRRMEVWNNVDDLLDKAWSYANGKRIQISRVAVDCGDGNLTPEIIRYCKANHARGVFAVKGQGGDRVPIVRPSKVREYPLFMVGIDGIKSDIMSMLRIKIPGDGYCHFPKDTDGMPINGCTPDFFAELTSERRIMKQDKKGFRKHVWEVFPKGANNHALDCYVYAFAALHIMRTNVALMLKQKHLEEPWASPNAGQFVKNLPVIEPKSPKKKIKLNKMYDNKGIEL